MKVIGGLFSAIGLVHKPKQSALPAPLPTATRDDAAAAIEKSAADRRRKGGAADILTGAGGAEAVTSGGKQTLGS